MEAVYDGTDENEVGEEWVAKFREAGIRIISGGCPHYLYLGRKFRNVSHESPRVAVSIGIGVSP